MLPSWRTTLFLATGANIIVLAFNLGFVLWVVVRHGLEDRSGLLYEGGCSKVRGMSVGLHFVVNILSMGLLAASNYCMQCLSAPTRVDIDRAHQRGNWVDIGVPSVRNLVHVSRRKNVLWILLCICSLPLHFIYNSTVFSIASANDYNVFVGAEPLGQQELSKLRLRDDVNDTTTWPSFVRLYNDAQADSLSRLTPSECFAAYATPFQTMHGNLLIISDANIPETDYLALDRDLVFHPNQNQSSLHTWMCQQDASGSCMEIVREQVANHNWTVNGTRVGGCLSELSPARCKLQYSLPLMMVIIAFNIIHVAIMIITALRMEAPILTLGDAVASFMNRPDDITRGHALLSRATIDDMYNTPSLLEYNPTPRRWYTSVSGIRWTGGILLYLFSITLPLSLLIYGLTDIQNNYNVWKTTLNTPSIQTLITTTQWPSSLVANSLIANTPQILFSMLYLATNGILTTMTLSAEWSNYGILRRGLRVSTPPAISQRTSCYLSLPQRYSLPLVAVCAILHFVGSQSLFLMDVQVYTAVKERDKTRDFITVGYAPAAAVASLALGTAMLIALLVLSRQRFASGMPVAGSCSLAIAAACHPPGHEEGRLAEGNPQAGYFPLKWGNISGSWGFSWE